MYFVRLSTAGCLVFQKLEIESNNYYSNIVFPTQLTNNKHCISESIIDGLYTINGIVFQFKFLLDLRPDALFMGHLALWPSGASVVRAAPTAFHPSTLKPIAYRSIGLPPYIYYNMLLATHCGWHGVGMPRYSNKKQGLGWIDFYEFIVFMVCVFLAEIIRVLKKTQDQCIASFETTVTTVYWVHK